MIELDENTRKALYQFVKSQAKVKGTFDKGARERLFHKEDHVLMWDKRKEKLGKHGKFDSLWLSPYIIDSATWCGV